MQQPSDFPFQFVLQKLPSFAACYSLRFAAAKIRHLATLPRFSPVYHPLSAPFSTGYLPFFSVFTVFAKILVAPNGIS
jgi:hypothetical protein